MKNKDVIMPIIVVPFYDLRLSSLSVPGPALSNQHNCVCLTGLSFKIVKLRRRIGIFIGLLTLKMSKNLIIALLFHLN